MEMSFSLWTAFIGNSYYFCKPHAEHVACYGMNLSACLALFTFDKIQLGTVVTFITHNRKMRRHDFIRKSHGFYFQNKSDGNSFVRIDMYVLFKNDKTFNCYQINC